MPRYLIKASYTADGVKGLLKDGGTGRRKAVEQMMKGMGGGVETFDYAFGQTDVYTIVTAPDNVTAASVGLSVAASGAVVLETVVLLSPEEIDEAAKKSVDYRPPGG